MRTTAGGALIKNNKILLGLRSAELAYYPCIWDIFGGHCEEGESIVKTLKREFDEELGVEPTHFERVGIIDEPNPNRYGQAQHNVYAVLAWKGKPSNASKEHTKIRWFTYGELSCVNLASDQYLILFKRYL
jgi:ADP-ribose pyrophosphatase YjhB (NUDIX family)